MYFNTCFDSYAVVRIFKHILSHNLSASIFLPKCGRNTIAEMLDFKRYQGVNVFTDECEPVVINPSLMNTLREVFEIKPFGSARKDAEFINNL